MTGFEPVTSSLPRKRSTPELHRLFSQWTDSVWAHRQWSSKAILFRWENMSGKRDSNPRPSAWKADALASWATPADLSSSRTYLSGESRIRTCEDIVNRFTVCPRWPLEYLPDFYVVQSYKEREPMEGFEPPTRWLQISCSGQLSYIGINYKDLSRTLPK